MARKPDRLANQIQAVQSYLRTARANFNRAYGGVSVNYRKRRICPFEQQLRARRFEDASRLLKLTELCLDELRHQRALSLSPFQPGDQIRVSVTAKGYERAPQRYLVLDVEWRKGDAYCYVVREVTKGGWLHRSRYGGWIHPNHHVSIEACAEPLDEETVWRAASAREGAKQHRADALERGKLELFDEIVKRSRW